MTKSMTKLITKSIAKLIIKSMTKLMTKSLTKLMIKYTTGKQNSDSQLMTKLKMTKSWSRYKIL